MCVLGGGGVEDGGVVLNLGNGLLHAPWWALFIWIAGPPVWRIVFFLSILVSFLLETEFCSQTPALATQVLEKQMCGNHAWLMSPFKCILLRIPV